MRSDLAKTPPPPPEPPQKTRYTMSSGFLQAVPPLTGSVVVHDITPPPPAPPIPVHEYDATQAEDEATAVILAILSGTGPLRDRLTSRAFILTIVGLLPSIIAGIGQLREVLPPQFAIPIYGATFLLTALYVAFSRYENVNTARAAAQVAAARLLSAPADRR